MKKVIVALEGLVHAGKSTLFQGIEERHIAVKCVGEYVEFVTERFPCFPESRDDARFGHVFFLNLEQKRILKIEESDGIVLLDRSIFSILAYNFAVEKMSDSVIPCFQDSIKAYRDENWLIPQVCVYLDIDDEDISLRHQDEKGHYYSIFLDNVFNAWLREFYEKAMPFHFPSLEIIRIDAHQSKQEIIAQMEEILREIAQ